MRRKKLEALVPCRWLKHYLEGEGGQDLIEYALLALLIVLAVVGAVAAVGGTLNDVYFTKIPGALAIP